METGTDVSEGNAGSLPKPKAGEILGLSATTAITLALIGLWGCLSIYNAKAFGEYPLQFALRQLGWLAIGVGAFALASKIPFGVYRGLSTAGLLASVAALLAVLQFGTSVNGMKGWFPLGGLAMLQPSEFAKTPFLLFLSVVAADRSCGERARLLKMAGSTALLVLLLGAEPDFGGALMFFSGFWIVHWISGGRLLTAALAFALFSLFASLFLLQNDYAVARLAGFANPDADMLGSGWHVKQFQYTLAHGGILGSSWGNALWTNAFLPLPHSDSVYASIVESAGFAGGLLVIGGFAALAWASYSLSKKAERDDARIFILATGAFIATQALVHISVNATLLPPTGMTLPFISYGGSSLVSTMIAFGVALSAFRERTASERP